MTLQTRLYLIALFCFLFFVSLGLAIVLRPRVLWDVHAKYFHSQAMPIALWLTASGRTRPLMAGYLAAIAVYALGHLHTAVPVLLALSQIVSQTVVEGFKLIYRRVRPGYWLHRLDKGHSYPSGHATTAVVSYVGWAVVIAHSALPPSVKIPLAAVFVVWAVGIDWSRLALGAHYFSDVFGGTLFGTAWFCALLGATGHILLAP